MNDELDQAEKTRLTLQAQVQRLEAVVARLEAELEADENPAARRRLEASAQKLAEVQAQLAPLTAKNEHQDLEELQRALSGPLEAQLAALRHAWRKHRHPRLADLIDCISTELLSKLPPIPTSELPAVFARRDPTEVSRLLTMPWPTSRELEVLVVQAILWLPDDPRVAAICAREIDLQRLNRGRYVEYEPLYERLNGLGDVRQLPVLERQLQRPMRASRELDQKSVNLHRALKPELPPEFEGPVQTLEERWAGWLEARAATQREHAAHLARVLEEPHETAHRLVFADWLSEHGDPRGEFINLQLGPQSEASQQRQQELIDAYWCEWLRPILDGLRQVPQFEGGFPVDASLAQGTFEQPLWRTFRSLTLGGGVGARQVALEPNLSSLRELRHVRAMELKELLRTRAPLTSIAVEGERHDGHMEEEPLEAVDFAGMPTLERLELDELQAQRWVNVLPPLKLVRVHVQRETAAESISRLEGAALSTLEVVFAPGTVVRLERDESGAFARAICSSGPRALPRHLSALPRTLRSLTTVAPPAQVTAAALNEFKASLSRFPQLSPGRLPLVLRAPRNYFRFEAERIISGSGLLESLERAFDLQLDHVLAPSWDRERKYWTEAGERGEPTTIVRADTGFSAVLPVLGPQAVSDGLKAFVREYFARGGKLSCEGRVLQAESSEWPTLEQFRQLLQP